MFSCTPSASKPADTRSPSAAEPATPALSVLPDLPAVPPKPSRGSFEDLPNEIVCDIAGHVFGAAVHDQANDVSSLACNQALRSTLHDELHANRVLRNIHACTDFTELGRALLEVESVFPRYRDGCLIAAIRLMPKLGLGRQVTTALREQLLDLLPPRARREGGEEPAALEAVLHALIETFRPARRCFGDFLGVDNVLAMLPPGFPVSPKLEEALAGWAADAAQRFGINAAQLQGLADRLATAAPAALRPRLQNLCAFSEPHLAHMGTPMAESMAHQMQALGEAQAAGDPDQLGQLHRLSRQWCAYSQHSPECRALFQAFFAQLDPDRQMWLVRHRLSPLHTGEVIAFLDSRVGQVDGTALLDALPREAASNPVGQADRAPCAALFRRIVEASRHTPERYAVLERAIARDSIHWLGLRPFLERCVAEADDERRPALALRLALTNVGCGERNTDLAAKRAPVSAELDKVLNDSVNVDRHAIETIVQMKIGWLDTRQMTLLVERIRQLPPAASARCLTTVIDRIRQLPSSGFMHGLGAMVSHGGTTRLEGPSAPVRVMVEACRSLPPEYRTQPVGALLDLLQNPYFRNDPALLRDAVQLYKALPAALRPDFTWQRKDVLERASETSRI